MSKAFKTWLSRWLSFCRMYPICWRHYSLVYLCYWH